jgi:hypothetical protein
MSSTSINTLAPKARGDKSLLVQPLFPQPPVTIVIKQMNTDQSIKLDDCVLIRNEPLNIYRYFPLSGTEVSR